MIELGRFEVESVISVGDCDQTEILVTLSRFDSSSGPGRLCGPVDVSNLQTSISVWSQSPTEMPLSTSKLKTFVF